MAVDRQVVVGHASNAEAPLESPPAFNSTQASDLLNGPPRLLGIVNDQPSHAVLDNLWNRPVAVSDDRRATGHRLDHDQSERLRPINREQEGIGITKKLVF